MIPFDQYYWTLKKTFPGDAEFGLESYYKLPYTYIIDAITSITYLNRQELHNNERPIAQLTSVLYNINRGKKTKALSYLDFSFYKSSKDGSLPDWVNGACMRAALKQGIFPSWCLFIYSALSQVAPDEEGAPECFIAQSSDVVVLNPVVRDGMLTGLVIINETASEKIRTLGTNTGLAYTVKVPKIKIKRAADENIELEILAMRYL